MAHGQVAFGQFVVAGRDAAEVLQLGKEPPDQVQLAKEPCAEVRFRPPVGPERDTGERSVLAERLPDSIVVICLVRQHDCSGIDMAKQTVMTLPGGQAQVDQGALPVDNHVDFGRGSASGTTRIMILIPLFAVAAC